MLVLGSDVGGRRAESTGATIFQSSRATDRLSGDRGHCEDHQLRKETCLLVEPRNLRQPSETRSSSGPRRRDPQRRSSGEEVGIGIGQQRLRL